MSVLIGAAAAVVLVSSLAAAWWVLRNSQGAETSFAAELDQASRELGIRFHPRRPGVYAAAGTVEDFSLTLDLASRQDERQEWRLFLIVSVCGPRLPGGIAFSAERGTGEDILTGDPVFDDIVEVQGEPTVLLALLTRERRQEVSVFVQKGGRLKNGRLTLRAVADPARPEVAPVLRLIVGLARDLSSGDGGGICERLARNAAEDPHAAVRLLNLSQLQDRFPETAEARQASLLGLADASHWVRLASARFLRDEGLEVLRTLVQDDEAPDQAAAEAVALLAARVPADQAAPLLETLLKGRSGDTRRQAIAELGRLRWAPAVGPLIVLLERADARTAVAAAGALARLGDPRAESGLIEAAGSDVRELRLPAMRALGSLGSLRSIEPLLALIDGGRLDAAGRQAARDAVAGIQSRLAGAGAGQLSLAASGPEAGQLSLVASGSEGGQLSLVTPYLPGRTTL